MMGEGPARLELLRGERDDLLRSLEDLETEFRAGDVEPQDYEILRQSYISRTSALLDAIELVELQHDTSTVARPFVARLRQSLGRRGSRRMLIVFTFVWVIVGVTFAALHFAGVRLPGQSETGSVSLSEALVVQQQLTQASELAGTGQIAEAISLYAKVLATVPHQHEALTYQGWLLRLSGIAAGQRSIVDRGDEEIALAARVAPGYPDARVLDAIALAQDRHDIAGALNELAAFARDHPSAELVAAVRPQVRKIYQQAKLAPPAIIALAPGG